MKKFNRIFLMTVSAAVLAACSGSISTDTPDVKSETINSRVEYITKCLVPTPQSPDMSKTANCYFYIRIDNRIPKAVGTWDSSLYFPQTVTGNTMFSKENQGVIYSDELLYNSAPEKKVPHYVFDPTGTATQDLIKSEPTIENLIAANKSNIPDLKKIDTKNLKIIWYVVKYQSTDKVWHVDGILTDKSTESVEDIPGIDIDKEYEGYTPSTPDPEPEPEPEPEPTPEPVDPVDPVDPVVVGDGEIEFDIHVQEHKDWNEIKTSIHVRDTVNCRIVIPVPQEMQAPADDVVIRSGEMYEYINKTIDIEGEEFTVNFKVGHTEQGIEIIVETAANAAALAAAQKAYKDGITFEIHTYVKPECTPEEIWNWVKETKCPQTSMSLWEEGAATWESIEKDVITKTFGQITSAYNQEKIEICCDPNAEE